MQKVDYRYSDSDFVAYLLSLGYEYTQIELKHYKDSVKAFVHFYEDKDTLLNLFNSYREGKLKVDILKFSKSRREINRAIKSAINN